MSKTPYEIRLELLRLAQDHIGSKFWNDWEKLNIEREHNPTTSLEDMTVPVFPTTEQILTEAAKFKKFVDKE